MRSAMERQQLTLSSLANSMHLDLETVSQLVESRAPITTEIAHKLSQSLGSSPRFWLRRSEQYYEDRRRLDADRWAQAAPPDLASSLGWIQRTDNWLDRIDVLLEFFGVPDLESWKATYEPALQQTQFRTTSATPTSEIAVAAWLRRAQLQTRSLTLAPYNHTLFAGAIPAIRRLTWLKDPAVFLPRLRDLCAEAGVAVALVKAPSGCPASGATYRTIEHEPMIVLSARYLTDDHLWFTFFHEAAHVLLHGHEAVHVDSLEPEQIGHTTDRLELEANKWAADKIISDELIGSQVRPPTSYRQLQLLARQSGIAPGLIVGHFQHAGALSYAQLNKAKRRYRWRGPSLETI